MNVFYEFHKVVRHLQAEGIEYGDAVRQVCEEHPDLAAAYEQF